MNAHDVLKAAFGNSADAAISVAEHIANQESEAPKGNPEGIQLYEETDSFINETEFELQKARELAFLESTVRSPF